MPHDPLQSRISTHIRISFKKKDGSIIPQSYQNLSYLRSGVDYSRFIGSDTAEELLALLLRHLNFWREVASDTHMLMSMARKDF